MYNIGSKVIGESRGNEIPEQSTSTQEKVGSHSDVQNSDDASVCNAESQVTNDDRDFVEISNKYNLGQTIDKEHQESPRHGQE